MTSTELITQLDELRAKATQGEWQQYPDGANLHMEDRCGIVSRDDWKWAERPKNYVAMSWNDKGAMDLNDAAYIIALHNAFPALRQAVLDGERYKAAAMELAKAVDEARSSYCASNCGCEQGFSGHDGPCKYIAPSIEETNTLITEALTAYRTAIDDSSK